MHLQNHVPLFADIVLLGGGHTHALVLQKWAMEPLPGVALTLISPDPTTPYTGMLPGHIAGHYTRSEIEIDLIRLARKARARIILDRAIGIDRQAKTVKTSSGRVIAYDLLSIDIGVTAPPPAVSGAEHGHAVRPLAGFADAFLALTTRVSAGDPVALTVIGGGLGGVELAFAMQHALTEHGARVSVTLIDRGPVLKDQTAGVARTLRRELKQAGITVLERCDVTGLTATSVQVNGREVPSDFTLFATGARPQTWLSDSQLDLHQGYISVGPSLQSTNDTHIFAAGDCAHLGFDPRPKAGVFAVRQAPILFDNLRAALNGQPLQNYRPQRDYLKLVSLGKKRALAHRKPIRLTAPFLWDWKDRIDRKFMDKFASPPFPSELDQMLCAGCGSKIGRGVLTPFMAEETGDDAALLDHDRVITIDHLRTFTPDPGLMARVAAVHAMGDVWAMGGAPETALAQVILPEMTPTLQARWMAEITSAASAVFAAAGAKIIGGHTSQGAELTIGFAVTGRLDGPPIRLSGAHPGDVLILTKPLGTGVLLAAEMRQLADGRTIAALWDMMIRPQGDAARLLNTANAMTDVTGFGLAGHLSAMCQASGTGAEIQLADLPIYPAAEALAATGLRSSIFAENFKDVAISGPPGARFDLLFDPQTCGGLLAAVPAEQAPALLDHLTAAGFSAAIIGKMTDSGAIVAG